MFVHVVNIIVLVMIPMVVIHVNGESFSLGMYEKNFRNLYEYCYYYVLRLFSWCHDRVFLVLNHFHEALELHTSEHVVPNGATEGEWPTKMPQSISEYFNR